MEYNRIVAVTGLSGLYELVSSKTDSGIVRSLEDNSMKFVSTRVHNFSHLESIEVYTQSDNVNLSEVFLAMKASEEPLPDPKADNKTLQAYFAKVFPDMDFSRVYGSDMKKMVKWFAVLKSNDIEIKLREEEAPEEVEEEQTEPVEEKAVAEEKPAKKSAKKKEQANEAVAETKETAPKKKAAKATTDEEDAAPKKPARPAGGKAAPKKKKAEE